jgi:hypothetical protein
MNRLLLTLLGLATLLSLAGCDGGQARRINDLKQTGLAYHEYHDQHQVGPPGWDELIASAKDHGHSGESIQRVRDAGYEMTWGLKLPDAREGKAAIVLAKPPNSGPKLMSDGSVRQ